MPTLYLIDGHAQFFRAFHAIRTGMSSPVTKEPTNMTFGFTGMVLKLLREYKPDYVAVVIDVAGDRETFRSALYPEYKANRAPMPEMLPPQIDRCLRVLQQFHVPVLGEPGVEADDVIASLVRKLRKSHPELNIRILSRDKDLAQLMDGNVELFDIHTGEKVVPAKLFGIEGVEPKHVRDILTLVGDPVDNIPGVPGIGPKTAAQLILHYGSIDGLLGHLHEIKGKRRENLEACRDKIPLSLKLVTLKEDVDVDLNLDVAKVRLETLDGEQIRATFRELGFNRHQDELNELLGGTAQLAQAKPQAAGAAAPMFIEGGLFGQLESAAATRAGNEKSEYRCIRTATELKALLKEAREAPIVAIDTETDQLSAVRANLCGVSIAFKPNEAAYIPMRSPDASSHPSPEAVLNELKPFLEDATVRKVGHNVKYDTLVFRRAGLTLRGADFDTMVASFLIDPGRSSHSLDVLALALLNHATIPLSDLLGKGKSMCTFNQVALERATQYAAEDADVTLRLCSILAPQLETLGLRRLFDDVEMPLVEVLAELEHNGIRVDPDELDRQRERLEGRLKGLRREMQDIAPHAFNPDSPRQLAAVLFNKPDADPPGLGIRPIKRGKTGPSTDLEVLDKLASDPDIESPLPQLVVEYRQLTKLVGTYLLALKDAINPETGRIHSSFHQTVAVTGRLASSDPNLQNIPIRTDVGREIRRAFVAEPDNVLISADYSQIELRILAHLSEDPALIDAFQRKMDIHTAVAMEVFGVKADDVSIAQRSSAKMVNFGIVYGITAYGLARRLRMAGSDVTQEQAARIITDYKARYSGIAEFLDACISKAQRDGYVETMLGRRRPIPQIHARDPQQRALGERLAINSVVQGSAADLIKLAMVELHRKLPSHFPAVRMLLQIHDELVFESPENDALNAAKFIEERMQSAMTLRVPLVVEAAWGANWLDAK
jgi:DNA polymerase-1